MEQYCTPEHGFTYILQDVSRDEFKDDQAKQILKSCVLHVDEEQEGPSHADVSIVAEGTEVLNNCNKCCRGLPFAHGHHLCTKHNLPTNNEVHSLPKAVSSA